MIRQDEVFKIGVFNKPHGIKGEIQLTFTDDIFDRSECDYLVCLLDGILVPFFIEEYRFKSDTTALIKFENIDTAEQARMFTNIEVFFPKKYVETAAPGEMTWNSFVGYKVYEQTHGYLGEVEAVENSTINTLFVIDYRGEELLVPAQEDFMLELDEKERSILMQLPEGLLQIDELESED